MDPYFFSFRDGKLITLTQVKGIGEDVGPAPTKNIPASLFPEPWERLLMHCAALYEGWYLSS